MAKLAAHRQTLLWAAMVLATLVSWSLSAERAFTDSTARTLTTIAILAVACVKIRFIGLDFMELRRAPLPLRLIFEGWVLGVFTVLVVLYLTKV